MGELNDLSKIRTKLDEFSERETVELGAPLKEFTLIFPARRDASGQLLVRTEFELYYYQAIALSMSVQLSEFAIQIHRIASGATFLTLFESPERCDPSK